MCVRGVRKWTFVSFLVSVNAVKDQRRNIQEKPKIVWNPYLFLAQMNTQEEGVGGWEKMGEYAKRMYFFFYCYYCNR